MMVTVNTINKDSINTITVKINMMVTVVSMYVPRNPLVAPASGQKKAAIGAAILDFYECSHLGF